MTLLTLAWIALGCAAVPALLYLWNSFLFREPPRPTPPAQVGPRPAPHLLPQSRLDEGEGRGEINLDTSSTSNEAQEASRAVTPLPFRKGGPGGVGLPVSVLIPARNEESGIEACVRAVLASTHVELEVIVLDDASTDRTADIVRALAAEDGRVRLATAPPLPAGWCGKQHACFALSKLATYDTFAFLDADVRLHPDALARMGLFLRESGAELVSGFPRQETGTALEKLLIPLINWLLLCFLPLAPMRRFRWPAFGAGCGQFFVTTRTAYVKAGGHAAVRASLHDGLTLPRAYRKVGFLTDICDLTNLATCRMYRSAGAVWLGLAKNAREGMAATGQIGFWTVVLVCGQVLPPVLLAILLDRSHLTPPEFWVAGVGWWLSLAPRLHVSRRFRADPLGAALHPVAVLLLLAVQWCALLRAAIGKPVGWKGRAAPRATP